MINDDSSFDDLAVRLANLDFHNFTFMIWHNDALWYILGNSTRVNLLKTYGVLIPRLEYMQTLNPIDRKTWIDAVFADWLTHVGYYPKGIMDFVPDTYSVQYACAKTRTIFLLSVRGQ